MAASVWFAIEDAVRASRLSGGYSDAFQLQTPATCERIRLAALDPLLSQVRCPYLHMMAFIISFQQVHSTSGYAENAKQWTIEP